MPALAGGAGGEPVLDDLCFGIGIGAILQVIIELVGLMARRDGQRALASAASLGGIAVGGGVMYATALLV